MSRSKNELWQMLLAAEAPASLSPDLWKRGAYRRKALPIWVRGRGSHVWDVQGTRYLDFVAAFGSLPLGHSHPKLVATLRRQSQRLVQGFGDVHPHEDRARLADRLSKLGGKPGWKILWAQSGSEAIELALKTALLATSRRGVLAFEGGFHGQSLGALSVSGWPRFRKPFAPLLARTAVWAPYASCTRCPLKLTYPSCRLSCVDEAFRIGDRFDKRTTRIGAVLVEPIQGRGGDIVPPAGYLRAVEREARRRGWLLIVDEVFTGFGRSGRMFAYQEDRVHPDLLTVGKALAGGLPLAAVLGRKKVMQTWSRVEGSGEAPHSATFLAHPLAVAAALSTLSIIREDKLITRAARLGRRLHKSLRRIGNSYENILEVRGRGLLAGIELTRGGRDSRPHAKLAQAVVEAALENKLFLLPGGIYGNVVGLSPPLTLGDRELEQGVQRLERSLRQTAHQTR